MIAQSISSLLNDVSARETTVIVVDLGALTRNYYYLQSVAKNSLTGICVFEGPGSFTGLRIGISTANAISYSLDIPIVSSGGDTWIQDCAAKLSQGKNQKIVLPSYGSEPNITKPRK